jgi:hypothetical protein
LPLWLLSGSERSAARLAHQSGGLGVPGSNPGAPTNKIKDLAKLDLPRKCLGQVLGRSEKTSLSFVLGDRRTPPLRCPLMRSQGPRRERAPLIILRPCAHLAVARQFTEGRK